MTNAKNNASPFANNEKRDAIVGFIKSDKAAYNAMQARFEAAKVLLDLGMTAGFILMHRASVKGIYGAEFLNADESVIYSKDLEERKKTSKGEKAQYARLDNLVNNRIKYLCETLESIEMEAAAKNKSAAEVAEEKIEKAKAKGTKSENAKRSFVDLQLDALQAMYNRTHKDQVSDAPAAIKHRELIAMLERGADILGGKLKTPELPK